MPRIYNVRAATGEYTGDDGQKHKRWQQIGVIIESKGVKYLKLESVPVGWDGWASLLEPLDKDGDGAPQGGRRGAASKSAPASTGGGFEDDDLPPF